MVQEAMMRFGFALPQIGSVAGPEALVAVAKRAEDLGYDCLWVLDRILWPTNPRAPYPIGDGSLPVQYKNVLDPMETLTFAAAHTSRIALGTGVLNLPWYNPILLARQLTTLDVLSAGRLRLGFGIGWSPDEYEAAGVAWEERGKRADESIQVLKKIWTTDPVEVQGKYYRIPKSFIGPKPLQKPHPPIYMAAFAHSALKRVATEADGWFPVGIPLSGLGSMSMRSRTWQRPLVGVPRSSSLSLPRAWKFTKRRSRRNVAILPVPVSKLPATLRQRENSALRRSSFTRSFYRRAKALKTLSCGWKISGTSQSKLDAID
jgi:probable F420-dependent oxidoreductase